MRRPPLLRERSPLLRAVLVGVVPFAYGVLCGVVLHNSSGLYGLLILLGVIAAFLSGLEHAAFGEAAVRGALAGLCFSLGVLVGRALAGGGTTTQPSSPVLFVLVAIVVTALAAALGARVLPRGASARTH